MEKRLPFRAFDGAFGTYYFQLTGDDGPCERANVDNPSLVRRIHRQYLEAGAEAIKTNTFAVNAQVFPDERERARLLREGYGLAAEEAARYGAKVFCDIGPVLESETGQAEEAYLEAARAFLQLGGTHFLFETQADFAPLKPAIEEIAETCPDAFVAVSFAVSQDGYSQKGLFYRTLIEQALCCPEVHMAGLNCVCGPVHMAELMLRLPETDKPLMALPNAGYPSQAGGGHFSRTTPRTLGKSWRSFRRRARWWWAAAAGPRRSISAGRWPAWRRQNRCASRASRRRKGAKRHSPTLLCLTGPGRKSGWLWSWTRRWTQTLPRFWRGRGRCRRRARTY